MARNGSSVFAGGYFQDQIAMSDYAAKHHNSKAALQALADLPKCLSHKGTSIPDARRKQKQFWELLISTKGDDYSVESTIVGTTSLFTEDSVISFQE